jgi:hypothetical protein
VFDMADSLVVTKWADAESSALAVHALLDELKRDPRVYHAYVVWSQARGLDALIHSLAARQTAEPTEEHLALIHAFGAVVNDVRDLTAVEARDLCDRLGLSYDWLPQLLVVQFRLWAWAAARGERLDLQLATRRRPGTALAAGRAQKGGAAAIARNVEWYYRAEIQDPPDAIAAIAREYARGARRRTDARSVVQAGIRRAKHLLAIPVAVPAI